MSNIGIINKILYYLKSLYELKYTFILDISAIGLFLQIYLKKYQVFFRLLVEKDSFCGSIPNYFFKSYFTIFFIISILFHTNLYSDEAIVISEKKSIEKIGKYIKIFEDHENKIKPEDFISGKHSGKYIVNKSTIPNLGFSRSSFWIELKIKNESSFETDYLIEYEFAGLDNIEFYYSEGESKLISYITGDSQIFYKRPLIHKNFVFPIKIPTQESKIFYFKISSETTMMFPINVWNYTDFYMRDYNSLFMFGCFFGICFIMTIFHHLLFYIFKDKSFLFYSLNIFFSSIFLGSYYGFIFQYIVPNFPKLNSLILEISALLTVVFGILFSIEFMQLKSIEKLIFHKIFKILIYLSTIILLLIPFLDFHIIIQITSITAIIWNLVSLCCSIYLTSKKNIFAIFYFIGSTVFLFLLSTSILGNFGILPRSTITMYGFIFSYASEILLFSLGLGIKLQILRKEKIEIEKMSHAFQEKLNSIQLEINTASRIHRTILPSETPKINGLDMYAVYIPCNTIGGDFYDFHIQKNSIGIFIADVTGHGIPASLFASSVKYCFSKGVKYFAEPNRLMSYMNSSLYQKLGNQLLTASFLIINPLEKILSYASCGHPPLLIFKRNERKLIEIKPKGRMIGIYPESNIEKIEMKLEAGDRILLYTDGLTECTNEAGEAYGDHKLEDFFSRTLGLKTKSTSKLLLKDLSKFSGAKIRYQDDITYILIDVL